MRSISTSWPFVILTLTALLFAAAFALSLSPLIALLGGASALVTDPVVLALGLLIGLALFRTWWAVLVIIATSAAMQVFIANQNTAVIGDAGAGWHIEAIIARALAMGLIAAILGALAVTVAAVSAKRNIAPS